MKFYKNNIFFKLLFFSFLFISCNTNSYVALQNGSILKNEQSRINLATNTYVSSPGDTIFMEILYRRLLIENMELQAGCFIPGWPHFGLKYLLYSNSLFDTSLGTHFSYNILENGSYNNGSINRTYVTNIHLPLYYSINLEYFSIFSSIQTVWHIMKQEKIKTFQTYNLNLGTEIGKDWGLIFEIALIKNSLDENLAFQLSGSLYF